MKQMKWKVEYISYFSEEKIKSVIVSANSWLMLAYELNKLNIDLSCIQQIRKF